MPGFIPTPLGEVFECTPTMRELAVSVGIWALGALEFTLLAKASIAIELGQVRDRGAAAGASEPRTAPDTYLSSAPINERRSASLSLAGGVGGIAMVPHTPLLP